MQLKQVSHFYVLLSGLSVLCYSCISTMSSVQYSTIPSSTQQVLHASQHNTSRHNPVYVLQEVQHHPPLQFLCQMEQWAHCCYSRAEHKHLRARLTVETLQHQATCSCHRSQNCFVSFSATSNHVTHCHATYSVLEDS